MTPREAIETLLDRGGKAKTICPSEAARLLAGGDEDWRARMPSVHDAVDMLLAEDRIALSWKGEPKEKRRGPYRIARRFDHSNGP